jgi:hypothetical protein
MKKGLGGLVAAVLLVGFGYLAGYVPGGASSGVAMANPLWDETRKAYVTGDASSLTFWRMDGDKVKSVTTWAVRGDVFWSIDAKEGPPQLVPVPASVPVTLPSQGSAPTPAPMPAPAPAPAPAGGKSCGGSCGGK